MGPVSGTSLLVYLTLNRRGKTRIRNLRAPHTSRFFVGRQKNIFLSASVRWIQTSLRQDRGLSGDILTVLDLKTSCRALSASVRWTKTICRGSRAPQPIRKCHESHVSGIGAILILDDSAPSLNAVSRDKKSASVRQADGPTNFNPIWPRDENLQFYDKKSASVR